jgi:hypothetical protein
MNAPSKIGRPPSAGTAGSGTSRSRSPSSGLKTTLALVAFALAIRLVSASLAFVANVVFPLEAREQFTVLGRTHEFWDTFARYDSGWYWGIARDGYAHVEGGRSNLAFFPVYPTAMRLLGEVMGGRPRHFVFAGIAISWAMYVVAVVMLHRLAREDLDEEAAWRAVVLASVFPFAFFFGVVYSESTFLALMVSAFYGFRTGRWWLGGVAGALAVCTRVNGIMALPALAWVAWRASGAAPAERRKAVLALGLVAAGFAAWCGYVYTLSGSPFEWAASITRWNYQPGSSPIGIFGGLLANLVTQPYTFLTTGHAAPYDTLNAVAALGAVGIVPLVWWRFGTGYGLFMLLNLALPLSSAQFEGLGRYCSVLFPIALWLATIRSTAAHGLLVAAFSMMYVLCLSLFTTVHPIF